MAGPFTSSLPALKPRAATVAAVAVGVGFQLLFGFTAFLRSSAAGFDLAIFAAAGQALAQGLDPYLIQLHPAEPLGAFLAERCCFANPPNALLFARLYAMASFPTLLRVVQGINLVSLLGMAALCVRMLPRGAPAWAVPMVVALVLVDPFATHLIFLGQTSLVVVVAMLGCWFCTYGHRRPVLAGALLSLACLKPNLCVLLVAWLLLDRQWRLLLVGGALSALYGVYALALFPVGELATAWPAAVRAYAAAAVNLPGDINRLGLTSLAATLGVDAPNGLFLGVPATVALWVGRARFGVLERLGLLCGLTVLTSSIHNYDAVLLAPLLAALVPGQCRRVIGAGCLVVTLYLPQRWMLVPGAPWLAQWRVVVVAGLVGWVLMMRRGIVVTE